jgi:hypothetical protein
MSTSSRIGYEQEDGTFVSVYCHFDGYPSHNGNLLFHHYNDYWEVRRLVDQGNISGLDQYSGCPIGHTFDKPVKGFTIYYSRDRGDDWDIEKPRIDTDIQEVRESYGYVFKDNQWFVMGGACTKFTPLIELLNKVTNKICNTFDGANSDASDPYYMD